VLVLRVGARLLVKLAMKLGMPVRSEHEYSIFHRTSIATVRSSQPLTPRHNHATLTWGLHFAPIQKERNAEKACSA
jgi:hypothetical protein